MLVTNTRKEITKERCGKKEPRFSRSRFFTSRALVNATRQRFFRARAAPPDPFDLNEIRSSERVSIPLSHPAGACTMCRERSRNRVRRYTKPEGGPDIHPVLPHARGRPPWPAPPPAPACASRPGGAACAAPHGRRRPAASPKWKRTVAEALHELPTSGGAELPPGGARTGRANAARAAAPRPRSPAGPRRAALSAAVSPPRGELSPELPGCSEPGRSLLRRSQRRVALRGQSSQRQQEKHFIRSHLAKTKRKALHTITYT